MSWWNRNTNRSGELKCPHAWSMWEHFKTTDVYQPGAKLPVRFEYVQKRKCSMCGLEQLNKQEF